MIKAYLDSYELISVVVSKDYYDGKISSLYLLTLYGPQKLSNLEKIEEDVNCVKYKMNVSIDFDFNNDYEFVDEHGYKVLLEYRYIVKTERFNKETYTSEYLGYDYNENQTTFSIWAPISAEVILVLDSKYYPMDRVGTIFKKSIDGECDGKEYYYLIKNNGVFHKIMDPYAFSYNYDQSACVVVNLNQINSTHPLKYSKKSKVIYEVNVRDFSSSKKNKYSGKFLGLIDDENINYLDNLGIEYLQLMPITYFNGDVYNNSNFYNWGYNPYMYGVAHPNYIYNVENSKSVINECKEMINKLHDKGIKVVMDVVFNHVENREDNILNLIVPNYFYLIRDSKYSNGSYCGVDLDSNALMMRRFIKDMCLRWVKVYGVDGFRFDLMGILSIDAMNEILEYLKGYKNDIVLYGEGWDMPSLLKANERATINNAREISNIGLFNDYYRESLKYDYLDENILKGNYLKNNEILFNFDQSINYIECHDNYTYYDLQKYVELREEKLALKRQMFKNLIILISNGYAFFHAGQEFYRTKQGVSNSYGSLDNINTFDWNRAYEYSKDVNVIEKAIKIREKHNLFATEYEYSNNNDVITLKSEDLKIVINMSSKSIKLEKEEILLSTSDKELNKYDLVIYKRKGVR